jgi:sugar O-acyltransferase (sialic acid O-acetyltransferase NeuD family)
MLTLTAPVTTTSNSSGPMLTSFMGLQEIVIVGAGGFGREVCQWIEDLNRAKPTFKVLGFLDGDAARHDQISHDLPILGDVDWLAGRGGVGAVIGVGSPAVKRKLVARLRPYTEIFPSVIHPGAVVGRYVEIGEGVIICPGVIVTTDIHLGRFVTLNIDLTVGHDARIGDYCTLAPGVHVSGYVVIGEGTDIGTGANLVPSAKIGRWSIVGAGAVVSAELPDNCTAVGVPAKPIKSRPDGWQLA